jgi:prolyl 4-hydroxylase
VSRSDVEQGGETVFPASKVNQSEVPDWDTLSECAQRGLSVRPRMGDALLFWSMKPDATLDPTSLHGMLLFHIYLKKKRSHSSVSVFNWC